MEFIFRKFVQSDLPIAAPGELLIWPRDPARHDCHALARLVLEQGCEALLPGAGPIQRIVIQADPTFDDMLAGTFAERLIAGQPIPPAAAALAGYAELAREGLKPVGDIPLERSLEGIYLAVRHEPGEDLNDPKNSLPFLAGWKRVSDRLLAAAEANADPFKTPLFDGPEFARERTFLGSDREVFRQDVARGERWRISMPGGPAKSLALLLRAPKSILFKQWSRQAADPALSEPPLLLIVYQGGSYRWVISTDPVQQLSLKSLADALQAAEATLDPERAARDPWFDGKSFHHTLIAAPHGGGLLPERRVLAIIKHWAKGVPLPPKPANLGEFLLSRRGLLAAGGAAAVLGAAGIVEKLLPSPDEHGANRGESGGGASRGDIGNAKSVKEWEYAIDESGHEEATGELPFKSYALLIATNNYRNWGSLTNPVQDARDVEQVLRNKYFGFETELIIDPDVAAMVKALESLKEKVGPEDQLLIFIAGHGAVLRNGEGFLVGSNSEKQAKDPQMLTYLSHSRVREIIERLSCRHIFVILDVCFAGTFNFEIGTQLAANRGSAPPGPYKKVSRPEFIRRKLMHCGRVYLASCGEFVTASDGLPGQHSPFARQLLDTLNGGDNVEKTGVLTSQAIIDAALDLPKPPSFGTLKGHEEGGQFLFVRKEAVAVSK